MVRRPVLGRCAVGHGCRATALLTSLFVTPRIVSMRIDRRPRAYALVAATCLVALCSAVPGMAGTLEVKVADERGEPVAHVAVYATSLAPAAAKKANAPKRTAVMDQKHNEFVPNMLIVSAGTEVQFPNSDVVSHHVYSFSQAKTFELGLYKGNVYPPVVFDELGVVVLGCNIHNSMMGYIVVKIGR